MIVWLKGVRSRGVPLGTTLLRCFLGGAVLLAGTSVVAQDPPASAAAAGTGTPGAGIAGAIAIVPIETSGADQAATVTGALQVTQGKAIIATNGTVTSGAKTT